MGKLLFEAPIRPVSILVVGMLRKDGLDENLKKIPRTPPPGDAVFLFEKESNLN